MKSVRMTKGSIPSIVRNDEKLYEGDLVHYFRVVFNCARNLCNPYHNFGHMFYVFWVCYEACKFYRDELSPRQMRNLLIAALFHDFDHCGMVGNDDLNIERALRGLKQHIAEVDKPYFDDIAALIKATQYPYAVDLESLSLSGQILHDADASQCLSPTWIQQCVFGFSREWQVTPCEVLRRQKPFLEGTKFLTSWARERFSTEDVKAKIEEAMELLDLLGVSPTGFVCT